jgi:glutamine cyclotransferase
MKFHSKHLIQITILILITAISISCDSKKTNHNNSKRKKVIPAAQHLSISSPKANYRTKPGEKLTIDWQWKDTQEADSVVCFMGKTRVGIVAKTSEIQIPETQPVGSIPLILRSYNGDEKSSDRVQIELISNIVPEKSKVKIVRKLKHDIGAYTQGLEIHGDYFYESTGQWKESSMRKVEIETGKVHKIIKLKDKEFGEGMTIFGDKIYQLTWQSNTGYVYDLKTFKQIYEFQYPTEGWGLTNDGTQLIMSDGSHHIYFIDSEYFTESRKMAVYDNNGFVTRLNELEYINGKILANVYGEDYIVIIDPQTGKITHKIDMSQLKEEANLTPKADVLNGLAWDKTNKKLYATGKYWPTMFEINIEGIN